MPCPQAPCIKPRLMPSRACCIWPGNNPSPREARPEHDDSRRDQDAEPQSASPCCRIEMPDSPPMERQGKQGPGHGVGGQNPEADADEIGHHVLWASSGRASLPEFTGRFRSRNSTPLQTTHRAFSKGRTGVPSVATRSWGTNRVTASQSVKARNPYTSFRSGSPWGGGRADLWESNAQTASRVGDHGV